MKHSVVINDCGHAELSGYRQAGRNGGSQDSDAPAADGHQKDTEESGGIQIPGHTAQGDLFPDCQKDVKDQQDAAGSVDHEADPQRLTDSARSPLKLIMADCRMPARSTRNEYMVLDLLYLYFARFSVYCSWLHRYRQG